MFVKISKYELPWNDVDVIFHYWMAISYENW